MGELFTMREIEEVTRLEALEEMWVVTEAASLLGVKTGRVHAMIEQGSLPSRFATLDEVVEHYNSLRRLGLSGQEKRDLVEYLKSL